MNRPWRTLRLRERAPGRTEPAAGAMEASMKPQPDPPRGGVDESSALAHSARDFATRCHSLQRRASDGARFIEHPLEVARLLRDAGCSDVVVAAGLLHDVVEDTEVGADELRERFGPDVTYLVLAVTEDPRVTSYRRRKRLLREQVREAGDEAALLFAADKISKVRELNDHPRSDRTSALRMEHYRQSLGMLRSVAPEHPLVGRLAAELEARPLS
jgi:(p)ppGpp synthase/HD superfamily hydrolase